MLYKFTVLLHEIHKKKKRKAHGDKFNRHLLKQLLVNLTICNNILTKYIQGENKERAKTKYKTWTKSAYFKIFWNDRAELDILLQTSKESIKFIGSVTYQRMKSLTAKANAVSQTPIPIIKHQLKAPLVTQTQPTTV